MTQVDDWVVQGTGLTLAHGAAVAVREADFTFRPGEVTALVGPNGSGKSSLLTAVAGLLAPVAGTLTVGGRPPADVRRQVASVFQATPADALLPVTVREVVAMARFGGLGLLRRPTAADRAAVADAMQRLEVDRMADRHLGELSGGERQRVLVAQGLAQGAAILLLDEPLTGLDLVSRARIMAALDGERDAGRTVVHATHDLDDAEQADHVLLLAGRVVAAGPPAQALTDVNLRAAYGGRMLHTGAAL
jgi:ABC-type Mn2+/Zn2+ transport system ATPase subunit